MYDVIGEVEEARFPAFLIAFDEIWLEAIKRHGTSRSAGSNEQGHQKTPAFVHTILSDALAATRTGSKGIVSKPVGGTTDVGLHTGGKPRSTCFAIVAAVLEVILYGSWRHLTSDSSGINADGNLHTRFLANFFVWLLERQLKACFPGYTYLELLPIKVIDVLAIMLKKVCSLCIQLTNDDVEVTEFLVRVEVANAWLTSRAHQCARMHALRYTLGPIKLVHSYYGECSCEKDKSNSDLNDSCYGMELVSWKHLIVNLPPKFVPSNQSLKSLSAMKTMASDNLKLINVEVLSIENVTTSAVIEWVKACSRGSSDASTVLGRQLLILNRVEALLMHHMEGLASASVSPAADRSSDGYVANIEALLNDYRSVHHAFFTSTAADALMRVELRSRELLSGWICYCLVHAACKVKHPVVAQYGVALRWQDLKHLVLSDRRAIESVQLVAKYLRVNFKPNLELFSLRCPEATFDMARRLSAEEPSLQQLWKSEEAAAGRRTEAHWDIVRQQQEQARKLRIQITDLEAQMQTVSNEMAAAKMSSDQSLSTHRALIGKKDNIDRLIEALRSLLSTQRSQIRDFVLELARRAANSHTSSYVSLSRTQDDTEDYPGGQYSGAA
jgi:hypothetical protein